jgi:ribA/ribD-fused uncharacterized protein
VLKNDKIMNNYNLDKIIRQYELGQIMEYIFFWGHTPKKNQNIGPFCFSQWFPSEFIVDNKTYFTAEHWMMAEKARLFNDLPVAEKIINTEKAALVKELGRQIQNFNEEIWEKNRYEIVVKGNYYKFILNPALKEFLLSTKDKIIVEASPLDNIWGIGMGKDKPDCENPNKWKGSNLLGFALMEVRDKIKMAEEFLQVNKQDDTVILYRPVGPKELALIKESGWKQFPPRLPDQPIFYPVLSEEYASQIAKDWNVRSNGSGYVTKFEVKKKYILEHEIRNVGGDNHNELWIPAEELEEFNKNIIGNIKMIKEFN